jgi:peptidoglycan/xylan/chitin deacetylase (PgdA/CDA1 family)
LVEIVVWAVSAEGDVMVEPLSAHGPVKMAITVDDLFLWPDVAHQNGYSPASCSASLIRAFAANGVSDVYAFSATFALDNDPGLKSVLDEWCAAGHHVGGHTHFHTSLNWLDAKRYVEDIDQSHELIEPWVASAPSRYFRFAMDMLGDTRSKTDEVMTHLAQTGYMHAPISYWFYDTQFVFPYDRAVRLRRSEDVAWLRDRFVETSVSCLRNQVAASERNNLGRRPIHISLVHNSAIAADAYDRVLEAYAEAGVEFVTLEEAMRDPANLIVAPGANPHFRNLTQRWAAILGVEVEATPPSVLNELDAIAPIEGWDSESLFSKALAGMARGTGAKPVLADLAP